MIRPFQVNRLFLDPSGETTAGGKSIVRRIHHLIWYCLLFCIQFWLNLERIRCRCHWNLWSYSPPQPLVMRVLVDFPSAWLACPCGRLKAPTDCRSAVWKWETSQSLMSDLRMLLASASQVRRHGRPRILQDSRGGYWQQEKPWKLYDVLMAWGIPRPSIPCGLFQMLNSNRCSISKIHG